MIYYCLHQQRNSHIAKLKDLLEALLKNGLTISPKKCQLFRKELQYMDNTIFFKDNTFCIKPLWSRLEAIQNKTPVTVKGCRGFAGMVSFFKYILPWTTEITKAYIWLNNER